MGKDITAVKIDDPVGALSLWEKSTAAIDALRQSIGQGLITHTAHPRADGERKRQLSIVAHRWLMSPRVGALCGIVAYMESRRAAASRHIVEHSFASSKGARKK